MYIQNLFEENKLSTRSYNACLANDLLTVDDLKSYFSRHNSFLKLPNCGQQSNDELKELLNSTSEQTNFDFSKNEVVLYSSEEQLISSELDKLSVRSKNALLFRFSGYPSLYDIERLGFFSDDAGEIIANISNVGKKSVIEIKNFFIAIQLGIGSANFVNLPKQTAKEIIPSLTWEQRKIINGFIDILKLTLPTRSINIITEYFEGDFRARNIFSRDLSPQTIKNLPNSGAKSLKEIQIFIKQITQAINEINNNFFSYDSSFKAILLENNPLLKQLSVTQLTDLNGLQIIDIFIKEGALNDIELECLSIYPTYNEKDTLESIGGRHNVTRERVRQIRKKALKNIENILLTLKSLYAKESLKLVLDDNESFVVLSDVLIQRVQKEYQTKFSNRFIIYLVYLALPMDKLFLGNVELLLAPKLQQNKERTQWKNYYIIEAIKNYDFNAFVKNIQQRLSSPIEDTYALNFENFLEKFSTHNHVSLETKEICEKILAEEFDIYINLNDEIVFPRNVRIKIHEYAYNALKKIDKPSKIEEIYAEIKVMYPGYDYPITGLRGRINRENGFIPIGRNSVWGLKEWEDTKDGFSGGTMLELSIVFLEQFEDPKHISEIANYVALYRETNEDKLLSNLKFNTRGKFIFFRNRHIGLTGKKYEERYILEGRDSCSWKERYDSLLNFINTKNRLPKYSSLKFEKSLYSWFNIQERRYRSYELSQEQADKVESILVKFKRDDRARIVRSTWQERYNIFLDFINLNNRLPKSRTLKPEQSLYIWFNNQKKLYHSNKLSQEQADKIKSIMNKFK